jgi:copper transport protein
LSRAARLLAALAVTAVALLAGAGPAGAHAQLVSTTPTDGDRLDRGPTEVTLTFSEDVSVTVGQVRVLDAGGERVDRGGLRATGTEVTVPLRGDLDDGTYVVAWRAVSADSHPIHGAFTFGVGDGATSLDASVVDSLVGGEGDGPWRVVGTGLRVVGYGGVLLAVGLSLFLAVVHDGGDERPRLRRWLRTAAGAGAAGIVLELPVRAALATGLGPDSLTEPGVAGQVLADGVGIGMAVVLLALLFVAVDGGRDRIVAGAGVAAAGIAFAVAGHTATSSPAAVAIAADAAHVSAAAAWLGGLVGLLVVVLARRGSDRSAAPTVVRFSGVAGGALGVVTVAGAALGWTQVGSLRALAETPYGQLLVAKVAIVGLVALLGGWNRYRLVPVVERDGVTSVLRRTLAAEVALLALVVGVTAALVDITPARAAVAAPYAETHQLGDGTVTVDIDPTRTGRTTLHVYTYDAEGDPWPLPEGIEVRFSLPSAGVTGLERVPADSGPGHWTLIGDDLSIAGTWTVEVAARTSLYEEETASFTVRIVP